MLIVIVVVATVYWVAGHWGTYARILAGLWPLLVGFLVVIASLLEVVWWMRFDGWYYQFGPTVCREQWQTSGTDEQIRESIRRILDTAGWVGRESPAGFSFRRAGFWEYGSRVLLRLEETEQGTAVGYEVRPILAAPLWLPVAAALFFSPFRVFFFAPVISWLVTPVFFLLGVWAIAYYIWLAPREARRMARVRHIRQALAAYRLGVCEKCGYDLFGHSEKNVCPECGANFEAT
jgi:hypothetical protein